MIIITAVKKPIPQQFIRFQPDMLNVHHPFVDLRGGMTPDAFEVFNGNTGQWLKLFAGDYLNVTLPDDVYPVTADYFDAHYKVVR